MRRLAPFPFAVVAAGEGRLLDERDLLAHGRGLERGAHAGHATSDHEDPVDGIDTHRVERLEAILEWHSRYLG